MVNYIDEEKFLNWYKDHSKKELKNAPRLLDSLYNKFCETGQQYFMIPSKDSKTGIDEKYPFRYEDLGCCGASTIFIYF